ncbi:uncharacterized protein LOC131251794 [Magnolia sinica]|uniref:uncharacterized protein LOC131251794 n=1 Tax=Magnolia sinica TaxID=86752 RepID=UPI002658D1BA|nr:uncharacterized protein LOC131251794 [Magnolia sinica]
MALVMSCLPNVEFKNSYLKSFTVCRCKYSDDTSQKVNRLLKWDVSKCSLFTFPSFPSFGKRIAFARSPSNKMVSNGYISEDTYKNKIYRRLDSCLVIPPPNGKKPRAIIKFLGGAFVGAVPEVTYSHLMNLLAKDGFLIISVPFNVTFDHAQAAREVYERFNDCMDMLLTSGLAYANIVSTDLIDLPVYSVGHSNGALIQLLIGSYFSEKIPKANALISFNNRPASEAVPYFEQFGPMVSQLVPMMEASPVYEMARNASGDAWKALLDTAGPMIQAYDQEALVSLTKFVDQLPSVMNQVTQGISEFRPTPSENRDFCKKSYNVPHTLLVKFSLDAIDETDLLEEILKPRVESIGGMIQKVTLAGNHLTPCIQDVTWRVGDLYTPADALAQGLKSLSLNDTKVLARTISDWFRDIDRQ